MIDYIYTGDRQPDYGWYGAQHLGHAPDAREQLILSRDEFTCLQERGAVFTKTIRWKVAGGETSVNSGPHSTSDEALFSAYRSAFRFNMPFPSIRRHWWQIWRKEYSADEIEIIERAWKESSDD